MPLSESGILPQPLTSLYQADYLTLTYSDLVEESEELYKSYQLSEAQVKAVEEATRGQSKSKIWHEQHAGRVTASTLKAALATSVANPSPSLIKSICYPQSHAFTSAACAWGQKHESTARGVYYSKYAKIHDTFSISDSGLVIDLKYPFMGESPDGLVVCTCCGKGVLEIKCPYSCKTKSFEERAKEKDFFLERSGDHLTLKHSHSYFYQVQLQMMFCAVMYCNFVVWREDDFHVERITVDIEFINEAVVKVQRFIQVGILPELLGKCLTKQPIASSIVTIDDKSDSDESNDKWCYCRLGDVDDMIGCDNEHCLIQWFHYSCLGLTATQIPDGPWYCPDCSKI